MTRTVLAAISLAALILSSCTHGMKIMRYNVPDVSDFNRFDQRHVEVDEKPFEFYVGDQIELPLAHEWVDGRKVSMDQTTDELMEELESVSLLVIRNDSIIYEKYYGDASRETVTQIFSVSKTMVSSLVGIAIDEGYIKDVHTPVAEFLPEFDKPRKRAVELDHLLDMTAGFRFTDYLNLFKGLKMYYMADQERFVNNIGMKKKPGDKFEYSSYATLILGLCLEKAVGKSMPEYFEEKIWSQIGTQYDSRWSTDEENTAKMYGGFVTGAYDLAKYGRLFLNNGQYNDKQIIPQDWVTACAVRDTSEDKWWGYNNCWWLQTYTGEDVFKKKKDIKGDPPAAALKNTDLFGAGFKGQCLYIDPENNTMIIRLGYEKGGINWVRSISRLGNLINEPHSVDVLGQIDAAR